jgi:hypothetical protein
MRASDDSPGAQFLVAATGGGQGAGFGAIKRCRQITLDAPLQRLGQADTLLQRKRQRLGGQLIRGHAMKLWRRYSVVKWRLSYRGR